MNSAIHHLSATQMQADALRQSLRNPRLADDDVDRPQRERRRPFLFWRLRPAVA